MSLSDNALVTLIQAKNFLKVDATASLHVDAEFVALGDGTTKAFSLGHTPVEGSLKLYVNNVLQVETTNYSLSGASITFVAAPTLNYPITASYDYSSATDTFEAYDDDLLEKLIEAATKKAEDYTGRYFVQRVITESHQGDGSEILRLYKRPVVSITAVSYKRIGNAIGDGSTDAFSLGYVPKANSLTVYVDGVLKVITTDYILSGSTVTFTTAPVDGAEIIFRFEVGLTLNSDYFEQVYSGRLKGSWSGDYEYEVTYTAGYGTRAEAQAILPDVLTAVLLIISDIYETRSDKAGNINISGLGSTDYTMPSRAAELLDLCRIDIL